MSLFTPRKDLKTPCLPIIKIIICIIIIVLSIVRREFYSFFNIEFEGFLNILEASIFLCIGIIDIWIIYMSFIEIYFICENRAVIKEKDIGKSLKGEMYLLSQIVLLLDKNDIIEIMIKAGEKIVYIGVSSDCKVGSSKFFDKRFYIEDIEYDNMELFIEKLKSYSENEYINVLTIDDIRVDEKK